MANSIPFIDLASQYERLKTQIHRGMDTVLQHGQFILGPEVKALEQKLEKMTGSRHCIAVANGTDAIQLALMALGIGPGDEVITPSFSFFAAAEMISLVGAKPVLADISEDTYNLDLQDFQAKITARTKAVIPVNLYGQCADYDEIHAIAKKGGIAVIEDAAQSFGAQYRGRASCTLGAISTTSFFPSKPLGCYGDGGACFTDDPKLAEKLRHLRFHGQTKRYHHEMIGINSRLDTLQAAILLAKTEIFPDEVEARQIVAGRYDRALKKHVKTPRVLSHNRSVYAQYTIATPRRDQVVASLEKDGIPSAIHYPSGIHQQPVYRTSGYAALPRSEKAAREVVSLPFHPYLTEEQQARIVQSVLRGL